MFITRKFGKIFRGEATPGQLIAAAILGTTAGFVPFTPLAPGLFLTLFALVIVLNVNLAVVALTLLAAKFVSLFLIPVFFHIGRFFLDGPTEGLFAAMINAPVLALFGFEYYAVTGGLAAGIVAGILVGLGWAAGVKTFRRKMASLEVGSPKYQTFTGKAWVKLFLFIFVGGGLGKKTYAQMLEKRKARPIRPLGLAAVGGLAVIVFMVQLVASDFVVKAFLQRGLERANGATVDVGEVQLNLRQGSLRIHDLAMADPEELTTDLFRASAIEIDIDQADLLRKRFHMETVRVAGGSSGEPRAVPGIRHVPPEPLPPPPRDPSDKTIEDYIREAQVWRERLAQVRSWLEKIGGRDETEEEVIERPETRRERIEREIEEKGYRRVRADHLIKGAPTVLISLLAADEVRVTRLEGELVDVRGENLSTHPRLVERPARVVIRSSGETLFAQLDLGALSAMADGENRLQFHFLRLPVDAVAGNLRFQDQPPLSGGEMDVRIDGGWSAANVDFPLQVNLRNTRLMLPGVGETSVEQLALPLGVRGPWENPRIMFDEENLADALVAAGRAEAARRVRAEAGRLETEARERIDTEVRQRARGVLEGFRPGTRDESP